MADNVIETGRSRIEDILLKAYEGQPLSRIEEILLSLYQDLVHLDDQGLIPTELIPPVVFEHCEVVTDDTARFALTTDDVQNGDLVYVNSSQIMYFVVDDTKLDVEAGYLPLAAGVAAKAIADENGNNIASTYQTIIDSVHKLNADYVDDSNSTNKFVTAADKTKLDRVIMDSAETQDYYMQDSTPSSPSEGDYWFTDEPIVSADISAMTGYAKAQSASAIAVTDTLNEAMGKLEKKADDNTSGLSSKQNQVLGSWTAGTATTHQTPTGTDTVLQALQKIDNNQRNDENNISLINHAANTSLYFSETEPTGTITQGSYWISTNAVKIFAPTANLFNEIYTGLNVDITYRPMQVGDIDVTLSTTAPKTTQENAACLFLLAGNVSAGASTADNGAWSGQNRTVSAIDGYITIGYRHIGDVNPQDYNTMLNVGDTALPYVAYGNSWQ